MKAYVKIQSDRDISVTPGLDCNNVTDKDAHVANRLRVIPMWQKQTVLIKRGFGIYPSHITEWNTVKRLAELKVITIGSFCDNEDGTDNLIEESSEEEAKTAKSAKAKAKKED